ncbi:YfhE family protein [Bacillus taeanensis]|uniref:YfhE family protein n=1 Tax=Bacillus taeanensis TaxID=273032 RepID=A0A366XX01_9BACI|nr:YfhE family protein [Bacillus taeanensis]RBW70920.1 YfhE family protein [Bacillus taeanensis]
MAKKTQYQPTQENGHTVTSAQEVEYAKEFKAADTAGGYRKEKVHKAKKENPNLL